MAKGGSINFDVGFNVNKKSLESLKKELQDIQSLTAKQIAPKVGKSNAQSELNKIKKSASELQDALKRAFNPQINSLNVAKFNEQIQSGKINLQQMAQNFSKLGAQGENTFGGLINSTLTANAQLKQTNQLLASAKESLANTVRWKISSSIVNSITSAVQNSFNYIKALDTSLNDIRIVTGKSADDMSNFAVQANNAAKALGQTTTAYTKASLIYYQQGLGDQQVKALADTTMKVANITGQAADQVSEEITSVMNGYQISADKVQGIMDKLAAVAATTASDLQEVSTGMSKVASAANSMGVGVDALNAQLATIISVTRQAPESVGTALKTIYARLADLKIAGPDGVDEFGVSLGKVSEQLAQAGIQILDTNGDLRNMEEVMNEVGSSWDNWSKSQQVAVAEAMAGKRQYNNLIALFDNWDMYTKALNTSLEATGTVEKQNEIYMDSWAAKIKQLQTAGDDLKDSLINSDLLKGLTDFGTGFLSVLASIVDGLGGAKTSLLGLTAIATNLFDKQLNGLILTFVNNLNAVRDNDAIAKATQQVMDQFNNLKDITQNMETLRDDLVGLRVEADEYSKVMTSTDQQVVKGLLDQKYQIDATNNSIEDLVSNAVKMNNAFSQTEGEGKVFTMNNVITPNLKAQSEQEKKAIEAVNDEIIKQADLIQSLKNDASTPIRDIAKAQEDLRQKMHDGITEGWKLAENGSDNLKDIQKSLQDLDTKLIESKTQIDDVQSSFNMSSNNITSYDNQLKNLKQQLSNNTITQEQFNTKVQQLQTIFNAVAGKQGSFSNYLNELHKLTENTAISSYVDDIITRFKQGQISASDLISKLSNGLPQASKKVQGLAEVVGHLIEKMKQVNRQNENFNNQKGGFLGALKNKEFSQGITNLARGISQVAFSLTSLFSIGRTIKEVTDGTINAGQGLLQIISNLAITIPTLISGCKKFISSLTGITAAITGVNKAAVTASLIFETIGKPALIISAIIAGVTLIGTVIYKAATAAERYNKNMLEAADNQKKAYDELVQKQSELQSSFKNYTQARSALDDLTEGTNEWATAVENINSQVMDMIQAWPGLAQYVTTSAKGILQISQQGMDSYLAEIKKQTARQRLQSNAGTLVNNIQSNNKKQNQIEQKEQEKESAFNNAGIGYGFGNEYNEEERQTLYSDFKDLANNIVSKFDSYKDYQKYSKGEIENKQVDTLISDFQQKYSKLSDDQLGMLTNYFDSISNNWTKVADLSKQQVAIESKIAANNQQSLVISKQMAQDAIFASNDQDVQDKYNALSAQQQSTVTSIIGKQSDDLYNSIYEAMRNVNKNDLETAYKSYAAQNGIEVTGDETKQDMQYVLAVAAAYQRYGNAINLVSDQLEEAGIQIPSLTDTLEAVSEASKTALDKIDQLKGKDYAGVLQNAINNGGNFDLGSLTGFKSFKNVDDIAKELFDWNGTEEQLDQQFENLGWKSAQDFLDSWNKGVDNEKSSLAKTLSDTYNAAFAIYNNLGGSDNFKQLFPNLSYDAVENLVPILDKVRTFGGSDNFTSLRDGIQELSKSDPQKATELINALSDADFTTPEGLIEVQSILQDYPTLFNNADTSFKKWVDSANNNASYLAQNLDTLFGDFDSIIGIIDKAKNAFSKGTTFKISKDEVQLLRNYSQELLNYFSIGANGSGIWKTTNSQSKQSQFLSDLKSSTMSTTDIQSQFSDAREQGEGIQNKLNASDTGKTLAQLSTKQVLDTVGSETAAAITGMDTTDIENLMNKDKWSEDDQKVANQMAQTINRFYSDYVNGLFSQVRAKELQSSMDFESATNANELKSAWQEGAKDIYSQQDFATQLQSIYSGQGVDSILGLLTDANNFNKPEYYQDLMKKVIGDPDKFISDINGIANGVGLTGDQLWEKLSDIDWNSDDAISQAEDALEKLGIKINENVDNLIELKQESEQAGLTDSQIAKLQEQSRRQKNVNAAEGISALKSARSENKPPTVSVQQATAMNNLGITNENDWQTNIDGTQQYMGAIDQLMDKVKAATILNSEWIKSFNQDSASRLSNLQSLLSMGLSLEDIQKAGISLTQQQTQALKQYVLAQQDAIAQTAKTKEQLQAQQMTGQISPETYQKYSNGWVDSFDQLYEKFPQGTRNTEEFADALARLVSTSDQLTMDQAKQALAMLNQLMQAGIIDGSNYADVFAKLLGAASPDNYQSVNQLYGDDTLSYQQKQNAADTVQGNEWKAKGLNYSDEDRQAINQSFEQTQIYDQSTGQTFADKRQDLEQQIEQQEQAIQKLKELDKAGKNVDKQMQKQVSKLKDLNDQYNKFDQSSKDTVTYLKKQQQGIQALEKNYSKWQDTLSDINQNDDQLWSDDQIKASKELTNSMEDLLDLPYGTLTDTFGAENLDLIHNYVNGVQGSFDEIQAAAAKNILIGKNIEISPEVDEQINLLSTELDNLPEGQPIELGQGSQVSPDVQAAMSSLIQSLIDTGMDAQAAADLIGQAMGIDVQIEKKTDDQTTTYPTVTYTPSTPVSVGDSKTQPGRTVTGYTANPDNVTTHSQTEVFAIKSITKKGQHGGGISGGGGGGRGGGCFVAGTLISTPDGGFKEIQDIQIGDVVLSYNEILHVNEYSEVLETMIHHVAEDIYTLYIQDTQIEVTGIHQFYIDRNGDERWIHAYDLQVGDSLRLADGTHHSIQKITKEFRTTTVYNFEVSHNHNYYVSEKRILAHNKGCFVVGTPITAMHGMINIENIKIGDWVLSYNQESHTNEYSQVLDTMTFKVQENMYKIHINNATLQVTGVHKFLITRHGKEQWISAEQLQVGDKVRFANGKHHIIDDITIEYKTVQVYNFEVSGNHNYYVGKDQILAHNKGGKKGGGGKGKTSAISAKQGKHVTDQKDAYKTIEKSIDKTNDTLDKLDKASNKAFGKSKISNLQKMNQQLQKQNKLYSRAKTGLIAIAQAQKKRAKTATKNSEILQGAGISKETQLSYQKKGSKDKKEYTVDMQKYISDLNLGSVLQSYNGDNYDSIFQQAKQMVNAQIDKNNVIIKRGKGKKASNKNREAATTAQAQNDALSAWWSGVFSKAIEQFDEAAQKQKQARQQIQDNVDQMYQNNLQAFTIKVTAKLDLTQLKKDWADFKKSNKLFIDQNDFKAIAEADIEKVNTALGEKGSIKTNADAAKRASEAVKKLSNPENQKGIARVQADLAAGRYDNDEGYKRYKADLKRYTDEKYGTNLQQAKEDLQTYIKQGQQAIQDVQDSINDLYDQWNSSLQKISDKYERQISLIDSENELLQHNKKLATLIYGEKNYAMLKKYTDQQAKIDQDKIDLLTHERDKYQTLINQEKKYQSTIDRTTETGQKKWKESQKRLQSLQDKFIDTTKSLYSTIDQAIQHQQDALNNQWNKFKDERIKNVLDTERSLDDVVEEWQMINDNAERYLDTINSGYSLKSLQNAFDKALNSTQNSVKAQRELNALKDKQLSKLRQKDKLSQYDIDRVNKMLILQQKRLALEDAKQNKSQLKLRRDAQGNYSYQYAADKDKTTDARQEYLQAQNDVYNLDKQRFEKIQQEYVTQWQNFLSATEDLRNRAMQGDQQAQAQYDALSKQFVASLQGIAQDYDEVRSNLMDSTAQSYTELFDKEKMAAENLAIAGTLSYNQLSMAGQQAVSDILNNSVPGWTGSINTMITKLSGDDDASLKSNVEALSQEIKDQVDAQKEKIGQLISSQGNSLTDLQNAVDNNKDSVDDYKSSLEALDQESNNYMTTMGTMVSNADELVKKLGEQKGVVDSLTSSYKELVSIMAEASEASQDIAVAQESGNPRPIVSNPGPIVSSPGPIGPSPGPGKSIKVGSKITISKNAAIYKNKNSKKKNGTIGKKAKTVTVKEINGNRVGIKGTTKQGGKDKVYWVDISKVSLYKKKTTKKTTKSKKPGKKFDTGGYTGNWNSNQGRMAILHEKELVLNKADTANILQAVNIVRGLNEALNSIQGGYSLASFARNLGNMNNSSGLSQNIQITAQFPNAVNHSEIQQALLNLANKTSQYIGR